MRALFFFGVAKDTCTEGLWTHLGPKLVFSSLPEPSAFRSSPRCESVTLHNSYNSCGNDGPTAIFEPTAN